MPWKKESSLALIKQVLIKLGLLIFAQFIRRVMFAKSLP